MSVSKESLHLHCLQLVDEKINRLQEELKALTQSASSDTKSSMGDKYETSREMINLEKGKIGEQLQNAQSMALTLKSIDETQSMNTAELGAIVKTDVTTFYLSAPLGQVSVEDDTCFCISMGSPIARQMMGKRIGDNFQMAGKTQTILKIE